MRGVVEWLLFVVSLQAKLASDLRVKIGHRSSGANLLFGFTKICLLEEPSMSNQLFMANFQAIAALHRSGHSNRHIARVFGRKDANVAPKDVH